MKKNCPPPPVCQYIHRNPNHSSRSQIRDGVQGDFDPAAAIQRHAGGVDGSECSDPVSHSVSNLERREASCSRKAMALEQWAQGRCIQEALQIKQQRTHRRAQQNLLRGQPRTALRTSARTLHRERESIFRDVW